jgi:hypothetical protein
VVFEHLLVDIFSKCWRLRNINWHYAAKFLITCVTSTCLNDSLNSSPLSKASYVILRYIWHSWCRACSSYCSLTTGVCIIAQIKFKISVVVISKLSRNAGFEQKCWGYHPDTWRLQALFKIWLHVILGYLIVTIYQIYPPVNVL